MGCSASIARYPAKIPHFFENLQISRFIEFCSPFLRSSANPLLELIALDFGGCDTIGSSHRLWLKRPAPHFVVEPRSWSTINRSAAPGVEPGAIPTFLRWR